MEAEEGDSKLDSTVGESKSCNAVSETITETGFKKKLPGEFKETISDGAHESVSPVANIVARDVSKRIPFKRCSK